jgi:undecaprenyl diphosphate synthase
MLRAMNRMLTDCQTGQLTAATVDETCFASYLDTSGIPDPDLLIRTSGELRISNYLLWQIAYSELYFSPVTWPDFTKEELMKAIEDYNNRDRRFGGVREG